MSLILCTREEADNYLMHYRTKGSKNGMRRWQNPDGSLTPEGRIHYGVGDPRKPAQQLPTDGRGAKYKNPDGTLTEEGRNKYTYPTGLPDQNRMSLVGRARFGNKYSNAFNASEKAKWTKQAEKEWEQNQRQIFDEDSAAEKAAQERVDNDRFIEGSKAFNANVRFEKDLSRYDKLSDKDKRRVGDEVVKRLSEDAKKIDMEDTLDDMDADDLPSIKYEAKKYSRWVSDKVNSMVPEFEPNSKHPFWQNAQRYDELDAQEKGRRKELFDKYGIKGSVFEYQSNGRGSRIAREKNVRSALMAVQHDKKLLQIRDEKKMINRKMVDDIIDKLGWTKTDEAEAWVATYLLGHGLNS